MHKLTFEIIVKGIKDDPICLGQFEINEPSAQKAAIFLWGLRSNLHSKQPNLDIEITVLKWEAIND